MPLKTKKKINTLPFHYYYIPFLFIACIGFFTSVYLTISHYRVHVDISYSSFCAITKSLNCDTVSSSPYAIFLNVPIAVWGVVGYSGIIFSLIMAAAVPSNKQRMWPVLFWISLFFSISSLILAWVSTYFIQSYCIMCILTYFVNFFLLYYSWFVNKRFGDSSLIKGVARDVSFLRYKKKVFFSVFAVFLITSACLIIWMPRYWNVEFPPISNSLHNGVTEDGHPWIGAENPEVVIVEFSDYLCSQCRSKHSHLRKLIFEHSDRIRLIHRHFPMDHKINPIVKQPFHKGAAKLALLSIFATQQDKFWKINDILFNLPGNTETVNIPNLLDKTGLKHNKISAIFKDKSVVDHLKKDILAGLKHGLTGTPGFVIDGKVYQGHIPPNILKRHGLSKNST